MVATMPETSQDSLEAIAKLACLKAPSDTSIRNALECAYQLGRMDGGIEMADRLIGNMKAVTA